MFTIDETEDMLNEIAEEIPQEFYKELNGGIVLREEAKLHPADIGNDYFVMGEYNSDSQLGNFIAIYYGSFVQTYGNDTLENYKNKLRSVLKHEFRHHVERMVGVVDLDIEDIEDIQKYLKTRE
ncbi:hypothetical protein GH811_06570 [Acetobacterium malicum]|uniref:Metallopeptidase family protein n=1 Tax=Acetobacterium malicum TaxID=52692 RepID=A0ABR6YVQ0_9FIRM|nr:metallopeptidase family protein [Acetobacterium malicum]MBC3899274.1 hypothetical protein [Acetobacterium malicum]